VDHYTGLYYDSIYKKWGEIYEDETDEEAAAYNVLDVTKKANAFVFTTTGPSILGDGAAIDNLVANGNRNAVVFVAPVYGGYWDHPVGVYYAGSNWYVFNEDQTTMPVGQSFNVEVLSGTSE